MFVSTSAADLIPVTTLATGWWRGGYWSAAAASCTRWRSHNSTIDQGDSEPERVRTGNHEHGHDPGDRIIKARPIANQATSVIAPTAIAIRVREIGRTVGESLGARAGGLGLCDEAHDTSERRLFARANDLDPQGAFAIDGPGNDAVGLVLADGARFPRDHRLVH